MARTKLESAEAAAKTQETVPAASALPVPDGYAARVIVWPDAYWRVFDKQAQRGGLTTSEYLKRLLAHMARE